MPWVTINGRAVGAECGALVALCIRSQKCVTTAVVRVVTKRGLCMQGLGCKPMWHALMSISRHQRMREAREFLL